MSDSYRTFNGTFGTPASELKQDNQQQQYFESARDAELKTNVLTSPLTRLPNGNCIEGYWANLYSKDKSNQFPMPRATETPVSETFLKQFKMVTEKYAKKEFFFGGSWCRLCNQGVGNLEYTLGPFLYPSGIEHYYTIHHVHPSPEFVEFITNFTAEPEKQE